MSCRFSRKAKNMPIIIKNIKTPITADHAEIISKALKSVKLSKERVVSSGVHKSSLDARKRDDIHLVSSVVLSLDSGLLEQKLSKLDNVSFYEEAEVTPEISALRRDGRVVIAGFGPAGMFCGLLLAEMGYKPIVLERGADVDSRVKAVEGFWSGGEFDPKTNVQFGEGGAGTFSDGKLTTRINDPLCGYILKRLVEMGAPSEILTSAKPHIGTDKLRAIVKNIRSRIIELGGEVRFNSRLDSLNIKNGYIQSASHDSHDIQTSALVLAIGHSARDTFEYLLNMGVVMEPKAFSVGARIEHLQSRVDESLYGKYAGHPNLPKGEYQLSYRKGDRAVYTFCMCPGGRVVASSSEENTVVTNGMSEYSRDGENANSALVVSVSKDDFGSGVLAGVDFARSLERRAFGISNSYLAPCQTVGDFMGTASKKTVSPTYKPNTVDADLNWLFPAFVTDMMKEGIVRFSRQMSCFGDMGATLTAPETRTSSPVRITRNEERTALGISNLYPCGEGAGYAGGIVSAAVDGVKTALAIMKEFAPE